MKKLILLTLVIFALSGCKGKPSEITPFNQAITNYDETKTSGYFYNSIQKVNDEIINEDRITQKIDWTNSKAYTENYQRRVGLLNDLEGFSESYETTYYHNNQIGYQLGDSEVTWEDGQLSSYIDNEPPISPVYESYFEGYVISELNSIKQIKGTIKQPEKVIKNGKDVIRMELTIQMNAEGQLTSIHIEIEYPLSTVSITYEVFYEPQTVVIP